MGIIAYVYKCVGIRAKRQVESSELMQRHLCPIFEMLPDILGKSILDSLLFVYTTKSLKYIILLYSIPDE